MSSQIEIKSKFDAEFRRVKFDPYEKSYPQFKEFLQHLHKLDGIEFVVQYIDETESSLLPINNDDNFARAISLKLKPLRIILQKKGSSYGELHGYGQIAGYPGLGSASSSYMSGSNTGRRVPISKLISAVDSRAQSNLITSINNTTISIPEDFRRVSSIIDVDVVPVSYRRVKLIRNAQKPLGFFIRDGTSMRATPSGIEKVPGIFISRLVPKGLAESTGLLAVNDEIIEVNGIEVRGKTLDQVTDMMVANSSNLIITVRPFNQNMCLTETPNLSNPSSRSGSTNRTSSNKQTNVFSL